MDALILTVWTLIKIVLILVPLILCVAYLTLAERKVIGSMQVRIGPNRVGFKGLDRFRDTKQRFLNDLLRIGSLQSPPRGQPK